ncbi:hypothetical protein [Streptomyces noursei]|uniref:hypothetical protein n=1 Tax=Streptomyces noursei TaxID=1971 RepID=UPI0016761C61|nr:hypothetical protein [Streptomyces noursei]MCZ1013969.1 hypothetical protein [Streptomyces noursei]GGX40506.1 hypothetical protein GCM10010341_73040 [Streptomyces noursei]
MFTGTPAQLRRLETQAAEYAGQIAALLARIESLGLSEVITHVNGRITGPGFEIRRMQDRWTVRT